MEDNKEEHDSIKIPIVTKEFMPEGMILLAPRTTDLTKAIDKHPFVIKNVQVVKRAKRKKK